MFESDDQGMSKLPLSLADRVSDVLQSACEAVIVPRFLKLQAHEVVEKAKDELVTVADHEAEQLIAPQLLALLPGSRVVGEEACAADASLMDRLDEGLVWLVDPLDGTANFVAERPVFATMAALLHDGEAIGAWVFAPMSGERWVAECGAGTWRNGTRLRCTGSVRDPQMLRGAVLTKFLPPELQEQVLSRAGRLGELLPGLRCAGVEYPALITDTQQFAMFWRTLPWDHVPGCLLVTEAGGHVARYDGSPYRAADDARGLLSATNRDVWQQVHDALLA